MANMISKTGEPRREDESTRGAEAAPTTIERVAAGASTLTNQQLRKARESFDERISSQRERVTGRVRTLSRALKGAGEMLEEDDLVAQCLHFASNKVETVANYVQDLEPNRAADDLRDFARGRPAWFFGGAFALGLALGRFARSSTQASMSGSESGNERQRTRTANTNNNAPQRSARATSGAPMPGSPTAGGAMSSATSSSPMTSGPASSRPMSSSPTSGSGISGSPISGSGTSGSPAYGDGTSSNSQTPATPGGSTTRTGALRP